ncbi:MAG: hypothetical protein JRJ31_16230 [Deltaproteobacteria bacterium]|nr:hypothetical protein [Deltaproteobacteria bacterium]
MIILNFSHPLTPDQLQQVETLTGQEVEQVIEINSHIHPQGDILPQVVRMADECALSPAEWQTLPLLVNPPSLNFVAVALLAELHGRCGYFPAHLRLRPVSGAMPPRYEVAEILDLQALREAARQNRWRP